MPIKPIKPIKRALISVSDKDGLIDFAKGLGEFGVRILSSGGTATHLKQEEIPVIEIGHYTNFPEIMNGRVKTLHPLVHGGILADRENPKHQLAMESNNISAIDLVAVHLYPFQESVEAHKSHDECIEQIDIGGVALLRAAAKNYRYVTVINDPSDYAEVLADMQQHNGATSPELRRNLAEKAFLRCASYDTNISRWLAANNPQTPRFAKRFFLAGRRTQILRYGENPQQKAAFYKTDSNGIADAQKIQGKELSYNNINDANAAFTLISEFSPHSPACIIIKHTNPCGAAIAKTPTEAYIKARAADPLSAFGGIAAFNVPLTQDVAAAILSPTNGLFLEVLIAPSAEPEALKILQTKTQLRILLSQDIIKDRNRNFGMKTVDGGFLVQDLDTTTITTPEQCTIVTRRKPNKTEWANMLFAWQIVKHTSSNAIVYARDLTAVGICGGQTSRVSAARFAALKAEEHLGAQKSVAASDAFFPFVDALLATKQAGATAVIQSGGSVNDESVIKAANDNDMAMVFTDIRHFRH